MKRGLSVENSSLRGVKLRQGDPQGDALTSLRSASVMQGCRSSPGRLTDSINLDHRRHQARTRFGLKGRVFQETHRV
ncbi:hypothetical protein GCM10022420_012360 [Streptomyces iranensis]|uniref:Uncharacterized protein n=1 Tax=Streptomyces iranensis TaxID=576784 RepID=A0ABS4N0N3_9ACTN|nr:hypothetical protein [Streptomyces iranensis]